MITWTMRRSLHFALVSAAVCCSVAGCGSNGDTATSAPSRQVAAGQRLNDVSVTVLSMIGEEADAAATDLANEVSAQLS